MPVTDLVMATILNNFYETKGNDTMFTIFTKNIFARFVIFNALKSYGTDAMPLYKRACETCKTGELVLENAAEFDIWHKALFNYKPTERETRVYNALRDAVQAEIDDIECIELDWRYACMD